MKLNSKLGNSKLVLGASLLGLTALLSACGGDPPPVVVEPPATVVTVIAGTVSPWTAGQTGTIASPLIPEISTSIMGTGNFDLPLPTVTAAGDLTDGSVLSSSCSNAVSVTPGLKFALITDLAVGNTNPTYFTYSSYQGGVLTYTGWWFANQDATVTATNADCGASVFVGKLTANLNLKAGWNIVNYTQTSSASKFTYQISTGAPDNNRRTWRPNPISSQSLTGLSRQANPWGLLAR